MTYGAGDRPRNQNRNWAREFLTLVVVLDVESRQVEGFTVPNPP